MIASDGHEALDICKREQGNVSAAIIDVAMPVMGANELLPAIAALYPQIRILLTSGYSETEARRLCAGHPDVTFIQKPYTATRLTEALKRVLRPGKPGSERSSSGR